MSMTNQTKPTFRWLFVASANRRRASFCALCGQQAGPRGDFWSLYTDSHAPICPTCADGNDVFREASDIARLLQDEGGPPSAHDHIAVIIDGEYSSGVCRFDGHDQCCEMPQPRRIEASW